MTQKQKSNREKSQKQMHSALNAINLLKRQIELGNDLLRNRPINEASYTAWESRTQDLLKQSAPLEPLGLKRFSLCGIQQGKKVKNEAFQENCRAMTVYDKLSILGYHLNQVQKEVETPDSVM